MKPIFTSLTPNAEKNDIMRSIELLLTPGRWLKGRDTADLEHEIRGFLGAQYAFSFDSGRTSLFFILKALNLHFGDEVLLQAYTCVAVPDPVLWAGLQPIYVDIESSSLNMSAPDLEKKITPKSKVLIIQHTFGVPADIEKLLEIAKKHNLFVIEDCAHALGATYNDKLVGTFGDAAFFSFGRDKVISSTFGGLVTTNNQELAKKLNAIEKSLPLPSGGWVAQQLLHPVICGAAKATYTIGLGKLILWLAKNTGLTSKAVYATEKRGGKPPFAFHRLANGLAAMAIQQFKKLQRFNSHRTHITALYDSYLPELAAGRQKALAGSKPVHLRYLIRHPKAQEIIHQGKEKGIFLGDWYRQAIAPQGVDYQAIHYNLESCPNAQAAAKESLNLPTDIHIKPADAKRIIEFLSLWISA